MDLDKKRFKYYKRKYFKLKRMMSTTYRKHLSQPWFDLIKNKTKIYEGRINTGDWAKMKVGDKIIWFNDEGEYETKLTTIKEFKSFKDAINSVGLDKVLPPEVENGVEKAIQNVYYKYYKPEDEKQYGVILLKFGTIANAR